MQTNIISMCTLLEVARHSYDTLTYDKKSGFYFHHISANEVYGDLIKNNGNLFAETIPYAPSSPYSASKAKVAEIYNIEGHNKRINVEFFKPFVSY